VHDSGDAMSGLAQKLKNIAVRFSVMNDHRQTKFPCETYLVLEPFPLSWTRREISVVVKPDLADRHNLLLLCESAKRIEHSGIRSLRVVWVNAHRCVYLIMLIRDSKRFSACVQVIPNAHNPSDTGGVGSFDNPLSVLVKIWPLQVRMSIDQRSVPQGRTPSMEWNCWNSIESMSGSL